MTKNTKNLLKEAMKAAIAAFVGVLTAVFTGCTTINAVG